MKKKSTHFKAILISCICAVATAFSAVPVMGAAGPSVSTGTSPSGSSASTDMSPSGSAPSASAPSAAASQSQPTLWVVGDSTAAAFNDTSYYSPRYGWGTQLGLYFKGINIQNLAVSGTSSKSYVDTEQYKTLLQNMKAGDYLLIGFGHNDERAESGRYTNPNGSLSIVGSFQSYLYEKYIQVARDHAVTPVLCTPIVRRDRGNNYTGESAHITSTVKNEEGTFAGGNYAKAINQLGVGKSVPVLDLTARTKDVYERLGADGVKNRHAWTSTREVSIDNTHTNLYGAACNAWFIADELLQTNCDLKNYVVANPQPPEYSDTSLNPSYVDHSFNAPTGLSSIWSPSGDWKGTVFGDVDGYEYLNNMYFNLQPGGDGSIHMAVGVESNLIRNFSAGKIAQASDGIGMYYQAVPADRNFTLSADVTINRLNNTNQNSFGLMVRDDVYLDTVLNDTMGDYVAAGPLMSASSQPWNCFARKNGQLISGGTATKVYNEGETVHMEIRKSSDGYTCIFGDNPPVSAGFDFPLSTLDSSNVYAGMFIARGADVTFRNISLTLQ